LLLKPCRHEVESILDRPYFGRFLRSLAEAGHEICLDGEAKPGEGATLCARLGIALAGCVPPPGPLSAEVRAALAARGFAYALTAAGLDLLPSGRCLATPAVPLAAGSSWRVPAAWLKTRLLYSARRGAPVLRLDVQPCALYQPALRQTLLTLVRQALATRTPATCGELAARAAAP
jgi:predicted deacetylase